MRSEAQRWPPLRLAVLALAGCILWGGGARAVEVPSPLGLVLGASKSDVEKLGVEISVLPVAGYGIAGTARNLPKALRDVGEVFLFFGFDDRLWRVAITSTHFEHDRYGVEGRARFEELAKLLAERYGVGQRISVEPTGNFMQEPEHFAWALSQKERVLAMTWKTGGVSIELRLSGEIEDTFYEIAYESDALGRAARQAIKNQDKGAL